MGNNSKRKESINGITDREYYAIEVKLLSPLNLSNGESYYTDSDVLKNASGEYFIPGTSIAGAFRNYHGKTKNEECIYGFSRDDDGKMSSVFISDLYLKMKNEDGSRKVQTSIRDGVKLNSEKTVDNKFDMEIVERGAAGTIYISYIKRKLDKSEKFDTVIYEMLRGIHNGDIRFGARKNRGFGRFAICQIYSSKFEIGSKDALKEWLAFSSEESENRDKYQECSTYDEWVEKYEKSHESNEYHSKYITVSVPLKLTGGISIRKYSARPGNADFEHITSNQEPVIPGSSWGGAIRSDMSNILKKIGMGNKVEEIIKTWFGTQEENKAVQSMLVVSESIIKDAAELEVTRNKIDRFTGGTIESALYTERAFFGGNTKLEYMVRKDDSKDYKALLAMMELIVDDIMKGYVAIGGQVSIGRGIFSGEMSEMTYSEEYNCEEGMNLLYGILKKAKGEKKDE